MYRSLQWKILFLVCLFLMVSCGSPTPIPPVSDEEFDAAVQQAHDTMGTLRGALLAPNPSYRFVGVKVRFIGEDVAFEDHWTEPVNYYNEVFTVRLLDGFTFDQGLHPDRLVDAPLKDILDWMIVESDGKLVGGYTIRLAYEHMTPEEKEKFLKATGYKME